MKVLVTGATGFLGSHIAEQLKARGDDVRVLVRESSNRSLLEPLGVEFAVGDVTDAKSLPAAMEGIEVVYHAAAMVSDWAPWSEFRAVTINGTRNMLKGAAAANVGRFLHVSSDAVYRFQDLANGVNEESKMETKFGWLDYYRKSKTAAERVARRFQREDQMPVTIVRPALILGERDSAMLPGLIAFLKTSSAAFMGKADNQLPCVYAGDVADLCIRAATSEKAIGETYNAVNPEFVTQRDMFEAIAEIAGLSLPKRSIPLRVLYGLAYGMEAAARVRGWKKRPELTRFSINLIGIPYREDASKAIRELEWIPKVSMREAIQRSVDYARRKHAERAGV